MMKNRRLLVSLVVGVATIVALGWYVNTYIYQFLAAFPKVAVTVQPYELPNTLIPPKPLTTVKPNKEFDVKVSIANQNIDAVDLYLTYDKTKVAYFNDYAQTVAPGGGYTQFPDQYFTPPIIEDVTTTGTQGLIRLVLMSVTTERKNLVQLNFRFKALAPGEAVFTLQPKSIIAGIDATNNVGEFEKDPATPTGKVTIQTENGSVTPTQNVTTLPTVQVSIPPTVSPSEPSTFPTGSESTPSATQSPQMPKSVDVKMKIRFQGTTNPKPENRKQIVQVGLLANSSAAQKVEFNYVDNGIWEGTFKLNNVYTVESSGNNFGGFYTFFVKGPKHIRKKICDANPTESIPGTYRCKYGNIQLHDGLNELDFSNVILLAGDLPIQDGVVNSLDFAFIRQNFGSTDPEVLLRGDLNFDGIIHTDDHTLIKTALEFKYDDE